MLGLSITLIVLACATRGLTAAIGEGLDSANTTWITVLHVNDVHARYEPATTSFGPCKDPAVCFGGFARLAAVVGEQRQAAEAAGRDTLFLHAGDQLTGTIYDYVYTRKGHQVAPQLLNAPQLQLDAFVLGNHEFDYSLEVLATFIGNLSAPVISCNLEVKGVRQLEGLVKPFTVKTLPASGVKVGIVGLTTPETAELSKAGHGLRFSDPLEALPGCVAGARAQGAQIIIALTHIGASEDFRLAADPAAHDVDLVIGGHSHTLFYGPPAPADEPQLPGHPPDLLLSPPTPETDPPAGPYPTSIANGNKTIPVVSALWGSRYVGVMHTAWSPSGELLDLQGEPILLGGANSTNPVPDDPEVAAMVQALRGPIDAFDAKIVGVTHAYLAGPVGEPGSPDASLAAPVRQKETNLADFVADALISFYKNYTSAAHRGLGDAPVVALLNGGSFRASIPAGNITQASLISVFPFGNWVVAKKVNSTTLVAALENGLSQWAAVGPAGRFPQVGGLRYTFNHSAPAHSRLVGAWLSNGTSLDAFDGDIVLVTSDYVGLSPAGDGYTMVGEAPLLLDTSTPLAEILSNRIHEHSPIQPTTDGRIVDLAEHQPEPSGGAAPLFLWFCIAAFVAVAGGVLWWGVGTWRRRRQIAVPLLQEIEAQSEGLEEGAPGRQGLEEVPLFAGVAVSENDPQQQEASNRLANA